MAKPDQFDEVSRVIVDEAYRLHSSLGPGLLESAYESLLFRKLQKRGLKVDRQKVMSFVFDGVSISDGLRIDLLVEDQVVVEIKSVETLMPVHSKQVLTYLRALNLQVGLLVNFGAATMRDGLRRVVNGYRPSPMVDESLISRLQ